MWLALIAVAVGIALGLAAGGSTANLRVGSIRGAWLVVAGAACEGVADRWLNGAGGLWLVVGGYLLMLGFAIANLPRAGSVLIAAGLLSNLLVIGVNGGMPVRGEPSGAQLGGYHHGEAAGDRLTGLGDVLFVAPLGETLSAGDVLLASGVGTMAGFAVLGRRRPSFVGNAAETPGAPAGAGTVS